MSVPPDTPPARHGYRPPGKHHARCAALPCRAEQGWPVRCHGHADTADAGLNCREGHVVRSHTYALVWHVHS